VQITKACQELEQSLNLYYKSEVMFPMWFFLVLIVLFACLLYKTRITEEEILLSGKKKLKKIDYGVTENSQDN